MCVERRIDRRVARRVARRIERHVERYVEQGRQLAAERLRALAAEPAERFQELLQQPLDHPDRAPCDLASVLRERQSDRTWIGGIARPVDDTGRLQGAGQLRYVERFESGV